MGVKPVTNEDILEALNGFRNEMYAFRNEMYAFKDEMYAFRNEMYRFRDDVYRRFEHLEKRMDRLEQRQEDDHRVLMELWESRNGVTVKFSRIFVFINALISAVTAGTISFGVTR